MMSWVDLEQKGLGNESLFYFLLGVDSGIDESIREITHVKRFCTLFRVDIKEYWKGMHRY